MDAWFSIRLPAGTNLSQVDEWCHANCQDDFSIPLWPRALPVPPWAVVEVTFANANDMMLFSLTWS